MSLYQKAGKILQGLDATSDGAALMLAISNNMTSLALERFDMRDFVAHRYNLGCYLSLTATTGAFYADFFAGNYAATDVVHRRGAPAA